MKVNTNNFCEKLICWYAKKGRHNLPWRKTSNPYKILIAELMLQKTHAVEQVLPAYINFLKKYPNSQKLSEAKESEIKETIRSLGLQNIRARRFKKIAVILKKKYNNKVPNRFSELISLPGVGEYIANAVLCNAFDERAIMVDSNFGRVLGRVFYGKEEYPPSKSRIWKVAAELIEAKNCVQFNLAIIDLGALVCKPKSPKCKSCPVKEFCDYFLKSMSFE